LPINSFFGRGVHNISFVYDNGYRPSEIFPGNTDNRELFVKFRKISIN